MRNIVVCVKMVPAEGKTKPGEDQCLDKNRMFQKLNVSDMAAVEAALRQKGEGTVTVITMGTGNAGPLLKELLARGVDRAVLLTDRKMAGADTGATAAVLAAAIQKLGTFDLILCGRRAIDGETGQVPGELAARLGLPCITNAQSIETDGEKCRCLRLLENGTAQLEADLPVVASLCEYTYPLRLAGIRGIRKAAAQNVEMLSMRDLGLSEEKCGLKGSRTRVIRTARMESGLRKGPRETDAEAGVEKLISIIREKQI